MSSGRRSARRQRGIAVITAMLVVTIATILAVELAWHSGLDLRRTEGLLSWEQAREFGVGAEVVGSKVLQEWLDEQTGDSQGFSRDDDAKFCGSANLTFTIEQGGISGSICDVQGRFNLNNLRRSGDDEPNRAIVAQFQRLLGVLVESYELQDVEIEAIVAATVDWLDADATPEFNGAEEDAYTGLEVPYRPGNYPFVSLSEWRAVRGVTPELFEAARRCRCLTAIVPADGRITSLNILTASEFVYRSLGDDITDANATSWVEATSVNEQNLATEVRSFADPDLQNLQGYLGTASEYFELSGLITIGTTQLALYSLLQSTGAAVVPIHRRYGVEELRPVGDEDEEPAESEGTEPTETDE